jgi:glyoxylase-like metal-dependent hydrolase (beta-lactamase superfamily II)
MLRWQVGNVTVTSISEMETPTSPRFLFDGVTKSDVLDHAERAPWLRPHFVSEDGFLLQKIQCLVVETAGTVIAVDTCIGNDKPRNNPGWNNLQLPFLDDLAAAGYPPERVDVVVCTHVHVDHVGWNTRLVDGRWVPTFPNARYLFVEPEFAYWKVTPDKFGDEYFGDSVAPIVDAGLADLVAPDHRINDEVWFEPTPGHTPAHVSVVIHSGGERAVVTGDMTHTPLQIADPSLSSMFDTDPDQARVSRREAFTRWAGNGSLVIGTHFATPTAGRLVAEGEARWRFEV